MRSEALANNLRRRQFNLIAFERQADWLMMLDSFRIFRRLFIFDILKRWIETLLHLNVNISFSLFRPDQRAGNSACEDDGNEEERRERERLLVRDLEQKLFRHHLDADQREHDAEARLE